MTKNTEDPDSTGQPPDTNRQRYLTGVHSHPDERVVFDGIARAMFEVTQ